MVNDVMEELQCGICLDEYNIPRLLHCGHSFCADCLKSIQYGLHIKCPTCRQVTKLQHPPLQLSPVEDHLLIDKQLPINYALTSVLDIVRNNPQKRILQCSEHQFEDQKFYCADCDQLLCSECLIIPVEMLISTDDCSTISHSGHRVVTLKRGAIELLDSLQKRQVEANAALKTLDELTSELKESINQLGRNANIARERIAEEFAKITREVEERKSQLSAEIQSDADRNRAAAEQRLADIQEVRKCIQDLHNNTHELLASKKLQPLLTVVQSQNSEGRPSSETSDTSARKFSIASSNTSLDRATPAIREAIQSLWQQGHQLKRAWADCQPLSVEELQTALRLQLTFAECRFDQATFANALQNLTQLGRIETNRQEPDVAQRLFVRKGTPVQSDIVQAINNM
jgi:hypothetical protein